jgi:hypothetical protein
VIRAGLLQSTLILLPAEEKIATVFGGDTVDWVFDGGHVASRFISVKPKLANATTDNHAFMRSETAEAIDFVLYCERDHTGRRRVRELITVGGYSHADQSFQTEEVYRAPSA